MRNWMADLRTLPDTHLTVQHNPMSLRYSRALNKLWLVVRDGQLLGHREMDRHISEIAVWCNSGVEKRCGYYACFRIFYDKIDNASSAIMFCFYDGTEKSPCMKSVSSAQTYAKSEGFKLEE